MAYLQHVPGTQQSLQSDVQNTLERDQRKLAVDKFLARAEIGMVSPSSDFDASIAARNCGCVAALRRGSMPSCRPSCV